MHDGNGVLNASPVGFALGIAEPRCEVINAAVQWLRARTRVTICHKSTWRVHAFDAFSKSAMIWRSLRRLRLGLVGRGADNEGVGGAGYGPETLRRKASAEAILNNRFRSIYPIRSPPLVG